VLDYVTENILVVLNTNKQRVSSEHCRLLVQIYMVQLQHNAADCDYFSGTLQMFVQSMLDSA
jgi:hypothetical protein